MATGVTVTNQYYLVIDFLTSNIFAPLAGNP